MIWIDIDEEPSGKVYKKLIEYACKINDTLKFKGPNISFYEEHFEGKFEEICKLLNRNKEEIIKNYNNEKFMKDLYKQAYFQLKDNSNMIWSKNLEKDKEKLLKDGASEKNIEIITSSTISTFLKNIIDLEVFNRNFSILKQVAQDNVVNMITVNNTYPSKTMRINEGEYDAYSIKISDKVKNMILQYSGLYTLVFPNLFEDIEFSKNDCCWLETATRARICMIYPNNEKEIEYLKKIGLKFKI